MPKARNIHARFLLAPGHDFTLDVDLTLPGYGISAVFGASGSGKTSLLRCIAGLEPKAIGYLQVSEDCWQDANHFVPTHKRSLSYVFQESSLFQHLTVSGNLGYAVRRARKTLSTQQSDHILDILGIAHLGNRYPHQLSGGEKQRVAIARALLSQPSILLMDEPLASLDQARKGEILPYLERVKSTLQIPLVYVSHSIDEVARLADHVVVLDQGAVIAQGNVTDVFSRLDLPSQHSVEAGVVIEGRILHRDYQWHLMCVAFQGGQLWLKDNGADVGQGVRVRILAKDISISLENHSLSSILNRIPVDIVHISEDDDESMALLRLRCESTVFIARLTRKSVSLLQLCVGKKVWAQVKSVALVQ